MSFLLLVRQYLKKIIRILFLTHIYIVHVREETKMLRNKQKNGDTEV
jgi:hypothetical protein